MLKNLNKMVLRSIYLDPEMDQVLSRLAASKLVTKSVLIRSLLQEVIGKPPLKRTMDCNCLVPV